LFFADSRYSLQSSHVHDIELLASKINGQEDIERWGEEKREKKLEKRSG
jgi:hypothetical protein